MRFAKDSLAPYLQEVSNFKKLSKKEELELFESFQTLQGFEKQKARIAFLKANLQLVVWTARQYYPRAKLPLEDIIQEGNIGLITAIEKFDPKFNVRFATFAIWRIRQTISQALINARTVYVPLRVAWSIRKVIKTTHRLTSLLGRKPTIDEVSVTTKVPVEKLKELDLYLLNASSLDAKVSDDDERKLIDLLPDSNNKDLIEDLDNKALCDNLHKAIANLAPIEIDILNRTFALNSCKKQSQIEIGKSYGLSVQLIVALQEQALEKVRQIMVVDDSSY